MEIGASSACFYPLETEKAFTRLGHMGFKCSEIFFNSRCELSTAFVNELKSIRDFYSIEIPSLHPYASFSEGYNFFSSYERRFADGVESYKRYFEAAAVLGAKYVVLHGAKGRPVISREQYAERFMRLNEVAETFGCVVAHENVVNFSGAEPEFMYTMKHFLGDRFKMVLDVKQARRAGVDAEKFIRIMEKNIVHVHLSDYNSKCDCLPPYKDGMTDFERLFTLLENVGYEGRYIVELYSDNFSDESEVLTSAKYLDGILNKVRQD